MANLREQEKRMAAVAAAATGEKTHRYPEEGHFVNVYLGDNNGGQGRRG